MSLPTPRLSTRGTAGYSFAELYLTRGPQAIGVTGDNSLPTLIGRTWALVLDTVGRLRLFQRAETGATWTEQTELLPPLFDETHPESRRRFSIAFDQSARAIVAYEEDETVYLTRWDPSLGAYIQNVTVAGVDPVVVFDATWAYDVTVSDVLLFYLDAATRSRLLCRVQRDVYATAYELHDYGAPAVLDRVTRLPLRYQVLASDETGDPLVDEDGKIALRSTLYPLQVGTPAAASLEGPDAGDYTQVVVVFEDEDPVGVAFAGPSSGVYFPPIIVLSLGDEQISAGIATPFDAGAYVMPIIILSIGDEEIAAGVVQPFDAGAYDRVIVVLPIGDEEVAAGIGAPTGGSYATP